jgi:hypothetical protein
MNIFVKSGIITGIIVVTAVLAGVMFDSQRVADIKNSLSEAEILMNDGRVQSSLNQIFTNDTAYCESAFSSSLKFSDNIYQDGVKIENAEEVNRFTGRDLIVEKKRYNLLQMQFWLNMLELKRQCDFNYTVILFFTSQFNEQTKIDQTVQSTVLLDILEECRYKFFPQPIVIDLNMTSVDSLVRNYNITKTPSLVINDNVVLHGLQSREEIMKHVIC